MTTRSQQLYINQTDLTTGVAKLLYTVPANRRTIVRSISVVLLSVGPVTFLEQVDATGAYRTHRIFTLAQNTGDRLEFWRVLKAGDKLALRQDSGSTKTVTVWVSGAELLV